MSICKKQLNQEGVERSSEPQDQEVGDRAMSFVLDREAALMKP